MDGTVSFIGGDVFQGVPEGFDVVLIKHFLNMFDKDDVLQDPQRRPRVAGGGRAGPHPGADLCRGHQGILDVDYYPAFFLGCATGQGGPQKLSTLPELAGGGGVQVTEMTQDPAELPPDALPLQAILCATKTG